MQLVNNQLPQLVYKLKSSLIFRRRGHGLAQFCSNHTHDVENLTIYLLNVVVVQVDPPSYRLISYVCGDSEH